MRPSGPSDTGNAGARLDVGTGTDAPSTTTTPGASTPYRPLGTGVFGATNGSGTTTSSSNSSNSSSRTNLRLGSAIEDGGVMPVPQSVGAVKVVPSPQDKLLVPSPLSGYSVILESIAPESVARAGPSTTPPDPSAASPTTRDPSGPTVTQIGSAWAASASPPAPPPAQYHSQTMAQLTSNDEVPLAEAERPAASSIGRSRARSSAQSNPSGLSSASIGPKGPRPLTQHTSSNPNPPLSTHHHRNTDSVNSTNTMHTAPEADPPPGTQSSARRTDLPSQTIRDLEATLKELADLPDGSPPPIPSIPLLSSIDPTYPLTSEPEVLSAEVMLASNNFSTPDLATSTVRVMDGSGSGVLPERGAPSPPSQTGGSGSTSPTMTRAGWKSKPKAPRLSVNTLAASSLPNISDTLREHDRPPLSPGMKHWQQVRQHVLAPSRPGERSAGVPTSQERRHNQHQHQNLHGYKGLKYVTKAVERFGFRNAVENVMGHDRRGSQYGGYSFGPNLTEDEREEAARHRRRFARDIKVCLDNCAIEESNRRLNRIAPAGTLDVLNDLMPPKHHYPGKTGNKTWTTKGGQYTTPPGTLPMQSLATSTYAPLLTELHRYLPDARAKRIWSRTCPHHATILAELGVTFLQDGVSTDAERIQALEVFRTVVRNWSTDSADEELDRWLWLCRAMLVDDKPVRSRGLALLSQILRHDESLPQPLVRPMTADDFEAVAIALICLLHALESSTDLSIQQSDIVNLLLADLSNGDIIKVNTNSLVEISSDDFDKTVPIETLERELMWKAAGRALAVDQDLAAWLLNGESTELKRYSPPPVLGAIPPIVARLRVLSATQFFASLSTVVRGTSNLDLVLSAAHAADFVYNDARSLGDNASDLVVGYVTVLLDIELKRNEAKADGNPFSDLIKRSGSAAAHLRLLQLIKENRNNVVERVSEQLVSSYPLTQRLTAVKYFLESDLGALGRACVPHVLQRLTPASGENKSVKPFLMWLSSKHPQLFYKSLFTYSAATQVSTLRGPFNVITTISTLIGSDTYWTKADPQMVVIVLMGGVGGTPKKRLDANEVIIKAGRYGTMLELVLALQALKPHRPLKNELKTFLTVLETRLAAMLEVEERHAPLPMSYRSLVAQLFTAIRMVSWWTKKTAATRLAVSWFAHGYDTIPLSAKLPLSPSDDDQVTTLRDVLSVEEKEIFHPRMEILDRLLITSLSTNLVTVQASLSADDWATMLPTLWDRYSQPREPSLQMSFLLTKCAEQIPQNLHKLVREELVTSPNSTLLKLALLYAYRYQLLTQKTIADERGVFKFSGKVFEFVAAEMGSDQWVVPRDAQDQALKKYGNALPLELRQRLMELGWSEDKAMSTADYERIPVTLVPLTELNGTLKDQGAASAPPVATASSDPSSTGLTRTLSNSSNAGGAKARRSLLAPLLLVLINQQARVLSGTDDVAVATFSFELVRMVEREDAQALIRPINDKLPSDLELVIQRVNFDIASAPPGFAYAVINSLVGYLKVSVRDNPKFPDWQRILSTVARVVPRVSEMSLRDIRKTKAEPVLLPGSIYDDGAGFKLHQPWQNDVLPIQTAQLVILIELLRANPRDVYLIKKLLFNLQVQASFANLPFARAWLELVVQLFSGLNSNYNDRAEFRHFLNNITMVMGLHGRNDIIVAAQAMQAISVCSVRFRRVFASIGFIEVMRVVYETYVFGHATIKDCIEYALRSIYRIHRDVFVYQMCLSLADDPFNPEAAYRLLVSLAVPNSPTAGVASGIRGLNDKYDLDALIQMLSSGAEVSLSDLGSTTEERRAQKAANLNLGPVLFPRDNIIRLLVTVISVNAASPRAIKLLKLFTALVPYMTDSTSQDLLPEGVDAIGRFIHKEKLGDDQYMHRLLPGEENSTPDWQGASREYILLVDAAVKNGCKLSVHATRRLLDIVLVLLQSDTGTIGPVASSVLGSLTRTHLLGRHPADFLRDIAPTYRQSLATVDFSGVLASITDLIRRSNYDLNSPTVALVTHDYVAPVVRMLGFASAENMAFIVPVRSAAVELLAASVFLPGNETLDVLESVASSPGLLASVILPLVLLLDRPQDVNRDEAYANFWIRILRIVLHPMTRAARASKGGETPLTMASMSLLSVQILKVVVLRAPECISAVPGLWSYLANELLKIVIDGDGRFYNTPMGVPRVVDWMMWSLFELLVLHRTPLHIDCRLRIQTVLAKMMGDDDARSKRSSVASLGNTHGRSVSGLTRRPSARLRMGGVASPTGSNTPSELATPGGYQRYPSSAGSHVSTPSPSLAQQRLRSFSQTPGHFTSPIRPSFADLSARRASRPTFDAFPQSPRGNRFPSSSPVRAFHMAGQTEKSAIVHLLGPATHLASTASTGVAVIGQRDPRRAAVRDVSLNQPEAVAAARRAVATTMAVYGYDTDGEEPAPLLQVWSVPDALFAITEQTRMLVEGELREVFNPPRSNADTLMLSQWTSKTLEDVGNENEGSFYTAKEDKEAGQIGSESGDHSASFQYTLQSPYDEPSFSTFTLRREGDGVNNEHVAVPTLSISQFA